MKSRDSVAKSRTGRLSITRAILVFCSALVLAVMMGACGGTKADSTTYTDKLTIGTGMSGFDLVGEASTFSLTTTSGTLYFRLESSTDIGTRFVRLRIVNSAGAVTTRDVTPPQAYGHIVLSSFPITSQGSYVVHGYLVDTSAGTIETPIANANVTMGL